MAKVSKAEEKRRVQALHHALSQHARVEPNIYFWLVHVFHWHVAIIAAIALTFFTVSAMSGSSAQAQHSFFQPSVSAE